MKVIDVLKKKKSLSFEFFPPKTPEQEEALYQVISDLKKFNPDYVSVTYGALGTSRAKTFDWVSKIKQELSIEPVAHLTCVAASKTEIKYQIEELVSKKVENILALRGDAPEGEEEFVPPKDGFRYANDLVSFIKQCCPNICLGVAGYPEKHPEAKNLQEDIGHLKEKVEAGADYVVTQLFFDNNHYFDFKEKCEQKGIKAPIIPGIMIISSYKSLKKMTQICGASIPEKLLQKIEKHKDDKKSIQQIGVEHALVQCSELKKSDIPGLHFFVMNQSGPITQVLQQL